MSKDTRRSIPQSKGEGLVVQPEDESSLVALLEEGLRGKKKIEFLGSWTRCTTPSTAVFGEHPDSSHRDFPASLSAPQLSACMFQAQNRRWDKRWSESSLLTVKNHSSIMNGEVQGILASGSQFDISCPCHILCFVK